MDITQETVIAFEEFEGYKENIQPLKRGRKASALRKVCTTDRTTRNKLNKKEKEEFEQQLLDVEEDPLAVWVKYIDWTEQTFLAGELESELIPLLERCTRGLRGNETYQHDLRYLHIWLTYADHCKEPLDIYAYMDNNSIGIYHAALYIEWATALEDRCCFPQCSEVFEKGIKRKAEPFTHLEGRHKAFELRVLQRMQKKTIATTKSTNTKPKRTLGRLSTRKPNRISSRIALDQRGSSTFKSKRATQKKKTSQSSFTVFEDTDCKDSNSPSHGAWTSLPSQAEITKENVIKPSPWNEVKIPQKKTLPRSSMAPLPQSFDIFVDEEFISEKECPPTHEKKEVQFADARTRETQEILSNPLKGFD